MFATHGESGGVQVGLKISVCALRRPCGNGNSGYPMPNLIRLDERSILKEIHAKCGNVNDHSRISRNRVWSIQHFRRLVRLRAIRWIALGPVFTCMSETSSFAFSSPSILFSCSIARARASPASPSLSSALVSRRRAISEFDTRLSESICSSESFRFVLRSATNFSSVNNASSNGSVITWADVSLIGATEGAALGDGAEGGRSWCWNYSARPCSLVKKQAKKLRIKSRRIICCLLVTDCHAS